MTEVTIKSTPEAEDQAHIDAMVNKAEGKPADVEPAPTDGKADDISNMSKEDLEKSYRELRAKMSKDGAPKEEPKEAPKAEPENASRDEAAEAAEKAGVDMASIEAEFSEKGELSTETYESLEKAGFNKETVDAYIAGQQALAEQVQARYEQHVGGADKLNSMIEWAAGNLSEAEKVAFNDTIEKGSEETVKLALSGLQAKFENANGNEPKLVGGNTPKASDGSKFRSVAEVTEAMRNPKYTTDPAYRADVEAKLGRSDIL